MSRRRSPAAELVKLLEAAPQPLYALDEDLVVVYLNEACREMVGADAAQLPGKKCAYNAGSELTGLDAVAAGLCPPPGVLEGHEVAANIVVGSPGQAHIHRARFVPLRRPDEEVVCVVALVDPRPRTEELSQPADPAVSEAQELHEHLQRFRQQTALRYRWERFVGLTPAIRRARAQAEVAATVRASVLLLGPPGSGRRHLADVIHYAGPADSLGPLVPLECGLLDVESIQSTLRAAESHQQGTLLLGDADQLSSEGQAALAAILGTGRCPLRVISTAAAALVELWPRGLYREDLAALLSTITIELPPLARRRDDLPLLAQALLEERNARSGKQLAGFTPEALDRLSAYAWPGNVAELAEVVGESHVRASARLIAVGDLPERLCLAAEAAARPRRKEEPIKLNEFVAHIERELIRRALARSKGNKTKAARLLGLNRPRLYRRMVQLGLAEEGEE